MSRQTVIKIFYDEMTDEEFSRVNHALQSPSTITANELGVSYKIAMRIFVAIGSSRLGTVHIICLPVEGSNLEAHIRPFESGFPENPRQYEYVAALKFSRPIRVERMTPEEREAILAQRQNRSEK